MKQTINEYQFIQAFRDCGRHEQFSRPGLVALFEYLEQLEQDCGTEIELDPIAICCDFSEHDSAIDCIEDHGYGFRPDPHSDDEPEEQARGYLRENTTLIEYDEGVIIQSF